MPKTQHNRRLSEEKISAIFDGLLKLTPSKKLSIREIIEDKKDVVLAAIANGNSFRDIVNYLSKKGLNLSHETLRKIVGQWQDVDLQHAKGAPIKAARRQETVAGIVGKPIAKSKPIEGQIIDVKAAIETGNKMSTNNKAPSTASDFVTDKENEKIESSKFDVEPDKDIY